VTTAGPLLMKGGLECHPHDVPSRNGLRRQPSITCRASGSSRSCPAAQTEALLTTGAVRPPEPRIKSPHISVLISSVSSALGCASSASRRRSSRVRQHGPPCLPSRAGSEEFALLVRYGKSEIFTRRESAAGWCAAGESQPTCMRVRLTEPSKTP
jgi:hypothetical protein